MDQKHIHGQTERKVINYSPLRDNQDWLFGVNYDRVAFDLRKSPINLLDGEGRVTGRGELFKGYSGPPPPRMISLNKRFEP